MVLVSWMYLHPRVDVHSGTRTQYQHIKQRWVVGSKIRVPSYLGLVSWMYLHLRVGVHSGTRTQYRSLQTQSCYLLSY
ncbi:unnamed protein product [Schistosoma margrebowiei]|uniref:Uncharacterized protein n=1 Tax=Schistosoma margrebowiei TaxID=48269 RepID=A0A3P8G9C7_9TREM|nr:unnamed protein product [Schistosoma margrebowiei]